MPLSFGIGKARGAEFDEALYYSDYLTFYWYFTDGKDLDIISSFIYPPIPGQVGARKGNEISESGTVYMKWGGDNSEETSGYEAIYIDLNAIRSRIGFTGNTIEIDLRAIWYGEVGFNPVIIRSTGYEGGAMQLESTTPGLNNLRGFYNSTATKTFTNYKSTSGKLITSTNREDSGQRVSRARINLDTYVLSFIEDD